MPSLLMLYSLFPSLETARRAATALLEARLVACCNLVPHAESHYVWQGTLTRTEEVLFLAKTHETAHAAALAALTRLHPYAVPAILSFPADANPAFTDWVTEQTRPIGPSSFRDST